MRGGKEKMDKYISEPICKSIIELLKKENMTYSQAREVLDYTSKRLDDICQKQRIS